MTGVIILIITAFISVLFLGGKLERKSREVEELKRKLKVNVQQNIGDIVLNLDKKYSVIQEEGYFPTKDTDGTITFKIKGTRLEVGECANGFVYTRIYYRLDKENFQAALYAANQVEKSFVAIKVLVVEENESLIFSVESYCIGIETYRAFFQRSISIIGDSLEKFKEEMSANVDNENIANKMIENCQQQPQVKILS